MIMLEFVANTPDARMPEKQHPTDAGWDIFSPKDVHIGAGDIVQVGLGFSLHIPNGYVGLLCNRSSMFRKGVCIPGSPGIIDSGYTGEWEMTLANQGRHHYQVHAGDRIAQLVVVALPTTMMRQAQAPPETLRGTKGLGSSGR